MCPDNLLTTVIILLLFKSSHLTPANKFKCESLSGGGVPNECEALCQEKSDICQRFFADRIANATCNMTIFLTVVGQWRSFECVPTPGKLSVQMLQSLIA